VLDSSLSSKAEALSSIPSTVKNKTKQYKKMRPSMKLQSNRSEFKKKAEADSTSKNTLPDLDPGCLDDWSRES
jgi:hypothetical protein